MANTIFPQNKPISASKEAKKKKKVVFKPIKDRRFQLFVGFFLLFFSLYLVAAFVSYLFTAQADQSLVEAYQETGIREAGEEVENWLGIYGAVLSYYFIYRWFGLGAMFIPILLFVYGFRAIFRVQLLSLNKIWGLTIFASLWVSTLLGYLVSNSPDNSWLHSLAGVTGYEVAIGIKALLGWGTVLLLVFSFLIFVVYVFNVTSLKQSTKIPKQNSEPQVALETDKKAETIRKPIIEEKIQEIIEANDEKEEENVISTQKEEDELEKMGIKLISKNKKDIVAPPDIEIEDKEDFKEEENENDFEDVYENRRENLPDYIQEEEEQNYEDEQEDSDDIVNDAEIYTNPTTPIWQKNTDELISEQRRNEHKDSTQNKKVVFEIAENTNNSQNPTTEDTEEIEETIANTSPYDATSDLSRYILPHPELLNDVAQGEVQVSKEELEANKDRIVETLGHYSIGISSIKATIGPTVTLYEIVPEAGIRISKIKNLEDDIALSLAALGIRIIAPIPGKGTIGIEVPNRQRELVGMKALINFDKFKNTAMDLPVVLGKTVTNEVFMVDLTKMPHLLMAGATGQGKSVGLNVILASLLYKKHPSQLKLVLVDPKKVELTLFNAIERHFLAKLPNQEEAIITDTSKVINTLNSLCIEMDNRYTLLKDASCRNIKEYNLKFTERKLNPKKGHFYMPYIVLVIDELADLMMTAGKEIEQPIARLAQLARAVGIHLVVATQRPSVNVITGIIKANFPARLSFRVTSKIDSRTILDTGGAEQLIGMGDMLYSTGSDLTRIQCAFIDTPEVERLCEYISHQQAYPSAYLLPEYVGETGESSQEDFDFEDRDTLFEEAARIVVLHQQGSTSLLQRRLKIGYNRAGRLIDQLEQAGIVGAFEGSKAREVLLADEVELEKILKNFK
ncbi:MAG: DNA translocase FtsK [Thermonemataceae bacterium]|nr:DNA translocase FtsK [Thermonemataceae bacterium]